MGKTLCLMTVMAVLLAAGCACLAEEPAAGAERGLIPPPAISIPYGGKVVMEANLSDDDVLGIIKAIIPAIGELVGSLAPRAPKGAMDAHAAAAISNIDFKGFSDVISGITNVRVLAVKYGRGFAPAALMSQLDSGVAKLGKFSKVLSVNEPTPALLAFYAQPGNVGCIGYAFDSRSRTLYAARVIGFVDMAKVTKWITDAVKLVTVRRSAAPAQPKTEAKPYYRPSWASR
jgi:hypothetical protein